MTKLATNPDLSKSKAQVILEYILLALCLCVIALRTTFTESPNAQSANQPTYLSDIVYSLSISAVLFLSFASWFVWNYCSKKFYYRFTAMEIGLCLFTFAAITAGLAASNKRAAVTDFAMLIAPLSMAVLLVQILDSKAKIKLVLTVIAALGVVSAYQCSSQLLAGNKQLIKFYEEHPDEVLTQQNITPNTLEHWQFKHRLYSKDISGFFTTSNSAGSFALLASFAGIALFIEKFKNRKPKSSGRQLIICGFGVAAIIFGLVITRSKGAIAASLVAAAMLIAYLCLGNWLKNHKKIILITCLLLGLTGGCVVVWYGLTHGRLPPSGNSMLVRWQYWHASARMFADHPRTGVGPGNFARFYFHYKPASAMEEVADPHNFLLSILTRYGPLGLVGFLAMIFIPLWKVIFSRPVLPTTKAHQPEPNFRKLAIPFLIVISASLLFIRPMLMPIETGGDIDVTIGVMTYVLVMIYVIFVLYVAPVAAFVVGLWLLTPNQDKDKDGGLRYTCAALFCAVCGLLIHNLIDFAIFEPGVFTTFWAIVACLIALDFHQKSRPPFVLKPTPLARIVMATVGLVLIWACFNYALIPVAKSTAKIRRANQAILYGQFQQAHQLLAAAAEDDRLSPAAPSLNAGLYLHHYQITGRKEKELLGGAEDSLLEAINRDSADFKNFEQLTQVYTLLAETSTGQEKTDWLNKAFDSARDAKERYPGCGRLRIKLAKIAEQLGKTDSAITQYKKAIDIENDFRRQFRLMYSGEEIFSRLGEEKYNLAKQKIKQLSKQPTP
jgi:O-antigen ligase